MLPTTNSEIMLNANARPTLRPARLSWPERSFAATAPTVALSGIVALTKIWEPARRKVECAISRGTMISELTCTACRTEFASAPCPRAIPCMSRESRNVVPVAVPRAQDPADRAVLLHLQGHARPGQGLGAGRVRRRPGRRQRRRWRAAREAARASRRARSPAPHAEAQAAAARRARRADAPSAAPPSRAGAHARSAASARPHGQLAAPARGTTLRP